MDNKLSLASAIVLLGVSTALGFLGQPKEMALAIAAGGLGLTFSNLGRIRRFRGGGFDLETREQIEAVLEKETETEVEQLESKEASSIDGGKRAVLSALANPDYTWRYISGVTKETKLTRDVAEEALLELFDRGLVLRSTRKKKTIWSLTQKGRQTNAYLSPGGIDA